ncbi:MAG: cytochrome c oxidase subunit 3 [Parvibaculaceae bacterium]|nr:cytochrome c oxidase subunit 3 [Parvibaculaceae bacterium]
MADAHAKNHDYHLVDPSPWPFVGSLGAFIMAIGAIFYMHDEIETGIWGSPWLFYIGFAIVLYTMYGWWSDVVREAEGGDHTPVVQLHHRYGMIMFIASEVMFFVAWFWAYFDISLFPDQAQQFLRVQATGGEWPPVGIATFNPWDIPLINTLILLTSGTTATWAHHALLEGDRKSVKTGLILTVLLGAVFSMFQAYEYAHATFPFLDSNIYGSTFYMATGFHGFHVLIGTIFLAVCLARVYKGHFTEKHHFGFEAAAWYWHFVDVVWLFLFAAIYVWGAGTPAAH